MNIKIDFSTTQYQTPEELTGTELTDAVECIGKSVGQTYTALLKTRHNYICPGLKEPVLGIL